MFPCTQLKNSLDVNIMIKVTFSVMKVDAVCTQRLKNDALSMQSLPGILFIQTRHMAALGVQMLAIETTTLCLCFLSQNAIGHRSNVDITEVNFLWTPPVGLEDDVTLV